MNTAIFIFVALLTTISAFLNVYLYYKATGRLRSEVLHLEAQLAQWEKNAILRDPKTGRYVKKG